MNEKNSLTSNDNTKEKLDTDPKVTNKSEMDTKGLSSKEAKSHFQKMVIKVSDFRILLTLLMISIIIYHYRKMYHEDII